MIIRKVNALAGAGKTFAAVHYADRNARIGHKYALVQPTQDLIDETVKEIRKLNPAYPVTAIHGGTSDTVIRDIVDHTADDQWRLESEPFDAAATGRDWLGADRCSVPQ